MTEFLEDFVTYCLLILNGVLIGAWQHRAVDRVVLRIARSIDRRRFKPHGVRAVLHRPSGELRIYGNVPDSFEVSASCTRDLEDPVVRVFDGKTWHAIRAEVHE